jgi:hypothetical protein
MYSRTSSAKMASGSSTFMKLLRKISRNSRLAAWKTILVGNLVGSDLRTRFPFMEEITEKAQGVFL